MKSTSNSEEKSTGCLARAPRKFQGGELLRSTWKYIPLSTRSHRLLTISLHDKQIHNATLRLETAISAQMIQFQLFRMIPHRPVSHCNGTYYHLAATYASKRLLYGAGVASIMSACLTQQAQICCMELTSVTFNLNQFSFSSADSNSLEPVANAK